MDCGSENASDDGILRVEEPAAAAYAVGGVVAEPWVGAEDGGWGDRGGVCPICAARRDPVTGEPRYNARTLAAIAEGDAMLRGEMPAKWYSSFEEMLTDLDSELIVK